jgi:RAT1-interacting protein
MMSYWGELCTEAVLIYLVDNSKGYKFETLCLLPGTWQETSRSYIENRENEIVNNHAQYCSIVKTGIGSTVMILGGEVDAGMDTDAVSSSNS